MRVQDEQRVEVQDPHATACHYITVPGGDHCAVRHATSEGTVRIRKCFRFLFMNFCESMAQFSKKTLLILQNTDNFEKMANLPQRK